MSYVIPSCEVCNKHLTPMKASAYFYTKKWRSDVTPSRWCTPDCIKATNKTPFNDEYDHDIHNISHNAIPMVVRGARTIPRKLDKDTRMQYTLNRLCHTSWVALFLYFGYVNPNLVKEGNIKLSVNDSDMFVIQYSDNNKQKNVVGRIVRITKKILHPQVLELLTDEDFEIFHNGFLAAYNASNFEWKVVKGEDIREWYLERTYADNCGTLSSSCMRYANCSSYLDVYVKNPKQVKLLVAVSKGDLKLHGRALLWTLKDGSKYLDRPYGSDIMQKQFQQYGKKKNWQCYDDVTPTSYVELDYFEDIVEWPYLDTFSAVHKPTHRLYHEGNEPEGCVWADTTCGDLSDESSFDEDYDEDDY